MVNKFTKESDLCAAFIASLSPEWVAYPETAGFDILLIRKEDGFQIGVEAKLKLNAKVICQAAEMGSKQYVTKSGPDCRAALIPADAGGDLGAVCHLLGITVIRQSYDLKQIKKRDKWSPHAFRPELPKFKRLIWENEAWHEFAPDHRCAVPPYVPDVETGHKGPRMLTSWKIAAIKIVVTLEKEGVVTRQHFKHFEIDMSRWSQGRWLRLDKDKKWIRGSNMPDFRRQHPVNYAQIEADYEKWKFVAPAAKVKV